MSLIQNYALDNEISFLSDGSYIREILGIDLPLNESYPYSSEIQSKIIYEQILLESFWDDIKDMKDTTKNLFKSFKEVTTDPKRLSSFNSLIGKAVSYPVKQIMKLLNTIIEKLNEYSDKFPTLIKWAEKTKSFINNVVEKSKSADGWKGSISRLSLVLAVKFLWENIGEYVESANDGFKEILKKLSSEGASEEILSKVTEFLKSKIDPISSVIKEKFVKAAGKIATQFSGIGAWFDWAKTAFDGAKFVLSTLSSPLSKFQGLKIQNEFLIREYVREMLIKEINLGTGVGIDYTAFVLDADSARALHEYVPEGWQPKSHHMTIITPPKQKQRLPSHWLDFKDTTGQIKVVAVAKNDKVITGLVDLGGLPVPMKGPAFPHVTIAVNPEAGGKANMSNEFQISDFEPIKPIPITGKVEEILR